MGFKRHRESEEQETPFQKHIKEEVTAFAEDLQKQINKEPPPVIPEPEIIQEQTPVTEKKKRVDTKIFNNVGIVGDTVEVRDFRAIVKKSGKQINTVLTEILSAWNQENYNL